MDSVGLLLFSSTSSADILGQREGNEGKGAESEHLRDGSSFFHGFYMGGMDWDQTARRVQQRTEVLRRCIGKRWS